MVGSSTRRGRQVAYRKRRRHIPEMVARIRWLARILEVVFGLGALVENVKDVGIRVIASRISGTKIASIGKTPATIVMELLTLVAVRAILAGAIRLVVVTNAIEFGRTRVLRNIAGKVANFFKRGEGKGCFGWKRCGDGCWDGRWRHTLGRYGRWSC